MSFFKGVLSRFWISKIETNYWFASIDHVISSICWSIKNGRSVSKGGINIGFIYGRYKYHYMAKPDTNLAKIKLHRTPLRRVPFQTLKVADKWLYFLYSTFIIHYNKENCYGSLKWQTIHICTLVTDIQHPWYIYQVVPNKTIEDWKQVIT